MVQRVCRLNVISKFFNVLFLINRFQIFDTYGIFCLCSTWYEGRKVYDKRIMYRVKRVRYTCGKFLLVS